MNRQTNRLVLLLLVLNTAMILLGVFGFAWEARRAAAQPLVPTNRAFSSPAAGQPSGPWTVQD